MALGRLMGMNQIGLLDKAKCLAGVTRLSAWFFTRLFGQSGLDRGLFSESVGRRGLMGVGRVL